MTSRRELTVQTARKKGFYALGTGVGGVIVTGLLFPMSTALGVISLVGTAFFTWKSVKEWLRYRGEWGLRF